MPLDIVTHSPRVQENFPLGGVQGPPNVIWDPIKSRKLLELDVETQNTIRHCEILALGTKISPLGGVQGA